MWKGVSGPAVICVGLGVLAFSEPDGPMLNLEWRASFSGQVGLITSTIVEINGGSLRSKMDRINI
jgi:hypothetical protein